MCGMSDSKDLPASVKDVEVDREIAKKIKSLGDKVSSAIAEATVEKEQSCYMPTSLDQLPVIGRLPTVMNVYIASGHSCWGILNGPATGKVIADFIARGSCSFINASHFSPGRLL